MKKCPRCQYDIKEDDKFCPHCGLDLTMQHVVKKKKPLGLFGQLVLLAFLMAGVFYYYYGTFSDVVDVVTNSGEVSELKDVTDKDATMVVSSFDSLTDYNAKYSNVSSYVNQILDYENQLNQKGYTFDKEYAILVLDNNNVVYQFEYTTVIDDAYELIITKRFDRAHTYNTQEVKFKKCNVTSFNDLLLTNDEIQLVNQYTDYDQYINSVVNEFSLRETEFESKKETLGHYGMGTYQDKASFVVKKYDDTFTSVYFQSEEAIDYMC